MRVALFLLAVLALSVGGEQSARAQTGSENPPAEAAAAPVPLPPNWDGVKELVNLGLDLRTKGKDEEALAKFQEAYALYRDAWPLAQMALAKAALDDWLGAHVDLSAALAEKDHWWLDSGGRRQVLATELDRIRAHLARLDIRTQPAGAIVRIAGQELGRTPFAEPVFWKTGSFFIDVEAPGHYPQRRRVQLDPGTPYRMSFELEPVAAPQNQVTGATAQANEHPADSSATTQVAQREPIWLVAAAGGVAIAASAAIPWFMGNAKVSELREDCKTDCSDYESRRKEVEGLDTAATALLVGGSVVAVAGVTCYFLLPTKSGTKGGSSASVSLSARRVEAVLRW